MNDEKKYTVYKLISPNGKIYVGCTSKKLNNIFGKNGNGYRFNERLYNDIDEYGWENFKHEIVASGLNETEAYTMEKDLIHSLDSTNPYNGYNISNGGKGITSLYGNRHPMYGKHHSEESKNKMSESHKGCVISDETRVKISEALKGRIPSEYQRSRIAESNRNRIITEESKQKNREAHLGKRHTEESKSKISKALKGRPVGNETRQKISIANTGKRPTEESRSKMILSHIGKYHSEETRIKMRESSPNKKQTLCIETGIIYNSASEAGRMNNLRSNRISDACNDPLKTCGGYHWKYL